MPNVREGDLAVVVSATTTPELIGHYVIVERLWQPGERSEDGLRIIAGRLSWWVRSAVAGQQLPGRTRNGKFRYLNRRTVGDRHLRPIRDNEGEDEMLRIAGKPKTKEKIT